MQRGETDANFCAEKSTYGADKTWVLLKPIPIDVELEAEAEAADRARGLTVYLTEIITAARQ